MKKLLKLLLSHLIPEGFIFLHVPGGHLPHRTPVHISRTYAYYFLLTLILALIKTIWKGQTLSRGRGFPLQASVSAHIKCNLGDRAWCVFNLRAGAGGGGESQAPTVPADCSPPFCEWLSWIHLPCFPAAQAAAGPRESSSSPLAGRAWRPPSGDNHVCRQHCPTQSLRVYFYQCLLANLGSLDKVLGGPGGQDLLLRHWVSLHFCL